ncbi:hypothetical protein GZ449_004681 [Salmonella enterica]|nr:hypothetical protein [Salmonella enterica]EBK9383112.1 hypothetical protein [Salmonella enterica]EDT6774624.1 hypothetical protein [Salmonella enterica subsp. enterica]EEI3890782.1 hypothetical protein [Salmonella enterica]
MAFSGLALLPLTTPYLCRPFSFGWRRLVWQRPDAVPELCTTPPNNSGQKTATQILIGHTFRSVAIDRKSYKKFLRRNFFGG